MFKGGQCVMCDKDCFWVAGADGRKFALVCSDKCLEEYDAIRPLPVSPEEQEAIVDAMMESVK